MTLDAINNVHKNDEFVKESIKKAREKAHFPLINKGWKPVTIILLVGTKFTILTP